MFTGFSNVDILFSRRETLSSRLRTINLRFASFVDQFSSDNTDIRKIVKKWNCINYLNISEVSLPHKERDYI